MKYAILLSLILWGAIIAGAYELDRQIALEDRV